MNCSKWTVELMKLLPQKRKKYALLGLELYMSSCWAVIKLSIKKSQVWHGNNFLRYNEGSSIIELTATISKLKICQESSHTNCEQDEDSLIWCNQRSENEKQYFWWMDGTEGAGSDIPSDWMEHKRHKDRIPVHGLQIPCSLLESNSSVEQVMYKWQIYGPGLPLKKWLFL